MSAISPNWPGFTPPKWPEIAPPLTQQTPSTACQFFTGDELAPAQGVANALIAKV
jgi:hypothetical protein